MTILTRERRKGIFFLEVVSQQSSPRLLIQLSEWPTEQSRKFHLAHESSHPSFGWLLHFQSTPEAEHVFNLEHSSQVRLWGGGSYYFSSTSRRSSGRKHDLEASNKQPWIKQNSKARDRGRMKAILQS